MMSSPEHKQKNKKMQNTGTDVTELPTKSVIVAEAYTNHREYTVDDSTYNEIFTKKRDSTQKQRTITDILAAMDACSTFHADVLSPLFANTVSIDVSVKPTPLSALATNWAMNRKKYVADITQDSRLTLKVADKQVHVYVAKGRKDALLSPTLFTSNDMDIFTAITLNSMIKPSILADTNIPMTGAARVILSDAAMTAIADKWYPSMETGKKGHLSRVAMNMNLVATRTPHTCSTLDYYDANLQIAGAVVAMYQTHGDVKKETVLITKKKITKIMNGALNFDENRCKELAADMFELVGGGAVKSERLLNEIMYGRVPVKLDNNSTINLRDRLFPSTTSYA